MHVCVSAIVILCIYEWVCECETESEETDRQTEERERQRETGTEKHIVICSDIKWTIALIKPPDCLFASLTDKGKICCPTVSKHTHKKRFKEMLILMGQQKTCAHFLDERIFPSNGLTDS